MSTLLYAALSDQRDEAPAETSTRSDGTRPDGTRAEGPNAGRPGVSLWVDAVAALVPAEILAAQAFLIGFVTKPVTRPGLSTEPVTVVTNSSQARALFVVLLVASSAVYVLGALGNGWKRRDALRMWIPPIAFFLWSVLQPVSAFDGFVDLDEFWRYLIGVVGALLLAPLARWVAGRADREEPADAAPRAAPSPQTAVS